MLYRALLLVLVVVLVGCAQEEKLSVDQFFSELSEYSLEISQTLSKDDPDLKCHYIAPNIVVEWLDGFGGSSYKSVSAIDGCSTLERIGIGQDNPPQTQIAVLHKELNTVLAWKITLDYLPWRGMETEAADPERNILADYVAYLLTSPADQQLLYNLVPGDYAVGVDWDQIIDCEVLEDAHQASIMPQTATIPGGIPNLLLLKGC